MEASLLVTRMFILLHLIAYMNPCLAIVPRKPHTSYIKQSCTLTLYPQLCFKSLSIFANKIRTNPHRLALTALAVALSTTRSTPSVLRKLAKSHAMSHKVALAMLDCFEQVEDSVDELSKSFVEMAHINGSNFLLQINDVQTWVSAALTDADTCTDGFDGRNMDGEVKAQVRRLVLRIAHLTSNALALVNNYGAQHLPHLNRSIQNDQGEDYPYDASEEEQNFELGDMDEMETLQCGIANVLSRQRSQNNNNS